MLAERSGHSRLPAPSGLYAVWVGALLVYLGGCAHQPVMMATPVLYKDQRLDFMPRLSLIHI